MVVRELYKGFINEANYPVDLFYFAGRQTSDRDENDSKNLPSCQQGVMQHLGVQHDHNNNDAGWDDPSQDAHHTLSDWESVLKYEGTYVTHTHTFVARLHQDPSVIVQEYTVLSYYATVRSKKRIRTPPSAKEPLLPQQCLSYKMNFP
jgi:hypothetical protein